MLVLTRRTGEWISIGEDVVVKVLAVKGDHVQLGIEAPREVPVHRSEIREQILAETRAARESAARPDALVHLLGKKDRPAAG
jgi:carbon storage regulator